MSGAFPYYPGELLKIFDQIWDLVQINRNIIIIFYKQGDGDDCTFIQLPDLCCKVSGSGKSYIRLKTFSILIISAQFNVVFADNFTWTLISVIQG